jgi:hypothetical protein
VRDDPVVAQGIEAMGRAQSLRETAAKTIAQRAAGAVKTEDE